MNNQLIQKIVGLAGKAQFASFQYKTKETKNRAGVVTKGGELSRYTIILGARYDKLMEKSLLAAQLLNDFDLGKLAVENANDYLDELSIELMRDARAAVIASLEKSIEAHKNGTQSEDYTKKDQYVSLGNGLNINSSDNTLQLFGLIHSKVVLQAGVYKEVNSAIETIAKKVISSSLPIGKFREFALDLGNVQAATLNGDTLIFGDEPGRVTIMRPIAKDNKEKQLAKTSETVTV